jgi:hypothetical protein
MSHYEEEEPRAFYAEAQPCESCGHPTYLPRVWDAEYELWIGTDCSCYAPSQPIPACMIAVLEAAQTVAELMDNCKAHRLVCPVCGPTPLRKDAQSESPKEKPEEEAA